MTTALRKAINDASARGEKAMGLFLTSGFPAPDQVLPLLQAYDRGGADIIELGMPFSDPLAEGPPIQRSSARALAQGVGMKQTLRTAEAFCRQSDTPLVLMGYLNPVLRYGIRSFCRDARAAGVAGLILPDLPLQESSRLLESAEEEGLALVFLIAPNTADARVEAIGRSATGFVYAVSITGVTGSALGGSDAIESYLHRARMLVTQNPLLVGFGIRSHTDAMRLSAPVDGFIVGSACIELIEELWRDDALDEAARYRRVERFARSLKFGASDA